jgi:SAM-dependent methyltransferase
MTVCVEKSRPIDALRRHYEIEVELADRLRSCAPDARKGLYQAVYNELFRRVPDHPQNARKQDPASQEAATTRQLRLLRNFLRPDSIYLEIGAGDCYLPRQIAREVRHVYAIDVSDVIATGDECPVNFDLVLSDGVAIDVPPATVNVAYSNQLMEHLHPDDADQQLRQIVQALAPGGVYACITPHRFAGPHDISSYFDTEARGFHLKEYTYGELRTLFRRAGFRATYAWTGIKGRYFRLPEFLVLATEAILSVLPHALRRRLTRSLVLRPLVGSLFIVGRR